MKRYRVSAVPRPNFGGFWRSGRFFPNAPEFVELSEEEITPAILNEPMLLVSEVKENPEEKPRGKVKGCNVSADGE